MGERFPHKKKRTTHIFTFSNNVAAVVILNLNYWDMKVKWPTSGGIGRNRNYEDTGEPAQQSLHGKI